MENKLKINVFVNAPENPIFLLSVSESFTELGFQPVKGDLLAIAPENCQDIQSNEPHTNSKINCFLEVYKRELNPGLKQLDVFCSIKK
ncbi:MAG TPA: hypothetical protein VGQ59_14665 [Cyclobacteriaceae bacterium]|nr:hypothetical protein [Cyclobacteriaceae bacterium]